MARNASFLLRTPGFVSRFLASGIVCALILVAQSASFAQDTSPTEVAQWHSLELSFIGPDTSESAVPNPFTDYRLLVTFTHVESGKQFVIRGFYAADGNAAHSSADSGNVWKVRFSPDETGTWNYVASLRTGTMIAIEDQADVGTAIELQQANGSVEVSAIHQRLTAEQAVDFRNRGKLVVDGTYFRFGHSGKHWLKGGADSPENLLAYADFDGTYRLNEKARDGENDPGKSLHRFPGHLKDWNSGDPTWKKDKGKSLVGAMNYLASVGMNASYFLTLNIQGDGNDVWPYAEPDDFTRFDCSKLDQWEIAFSHMQQLGILIHIVTQETENEKLLDDGETGPMRKLYYRELISRFAHHPALVWNLGEENGPADFSPDGQNADQQRAMANELKAADPYQHPVVIHTHASRQHKTEVLRDILGSESIDGLSFQVDQPRRVHQEIAEWKKKSADAGHPWLIAMDEIGKWDTGVVPDSVDPDHDVIRHQVLWGSLMAGAAGVEWYFGANFPHNDLSSEDWRQRENMWKQTSVALDFFEANLPYWEMQSLDTLTESKNDYCFAKPGKVYLIYRPTAKVAAASAATQLDLGSSTAKFQVSWFDPQNGGELRSGTVNRVQGPGVQDLGASPDAGSQDWVVLVKRIDD